MKKIDEYLNIQIEKVIDGYKANAKCLPGTPVCGFGYTEYEAKYDLLAKLLFNLSFDKTVLSYSKHFNMYNSILIKNLNKALID